MSNIQQDVTLRDQQIGKLQDSLNISIIWLFSLHHNNAQLE